MSELVVRVGAVLLGLGAVAAVVAASGLVPITASSGHWPPTRWLLTFIMERSVSTHALGIEPPPLDDPSLVLRGAGHYEIGCRPCHGAPGADPSRITRQLTPEPPVLAEAVPQWEPQELFYVVKNGVKMTAMPAWPARGRDDEVWAMVAFLRTLPELSAERYRELAYGPARPGDPEAPEPPAGPSERQPLPLASRPSEAVETCVRCHGEEGEGREGGGVPKLAGQTAPYLRAQLHAYRRGARVSGIMQTVASAMEPEVIERLVTLYGADSADGSPPRRRVTGRTLQIPAGWDVDLDQGERIARRGLPERKVPSCVHCHGPETGPRNARYPALAGQHAEYLYQQLRLFADDSRGGSDYGPLMPLMVDDMTDAQMRSVAAWYASRARPAG